MRRGNREHVVIRSCSSARGVRWTWQSIAYMEWKFSTRGRPGITHDESSRSTPHTRDTPHGWLACKTKIRARPAREPASGDMATQTYQDATHDGGEVGCTCTDTPRRRAHLHRKLCRSDINLNERSPDDFDSDDSSNRRQSVSVTHQNYAPSC